MRGWGRPGITLTAVVSRHNFKSVHLWKTGIELLLEPRPLAVPAFHRAAGLNDRVNRIKFLGLSGS